MTQSTRGLSATAELLVFLNEHALLIHLQY